MGLEMKQIRNTMPQVGTVAWIGLRPAEGAPIDVVDRVEAGKNGLAGDFFTGPADAPRQVTLIQQEHIEVVAAILGEDEVSPELLRRNIVVSGVNLQALKKREFQIGDAVLHATGDCPPCQLMEKNLGPGGYNAMVGHGGLTARVVKFGTICVGDEVRLLTPSDDS